jgi:hypothetical protein
MKQITHRLTVSSYLILMLVGRLLCAGCGPRETRSTILQGDACTSSEHSGHLAA